VIEGIIRNELGLTAWSLTVEPMIHPLHARNANFHFMELETLKDLYIHELKDLHSAERQLVKALPKLAKTAINVAAAK
jgi:Domain of unknown function (DUF892)